MATTTNTDKAAQATAATKTVEVNEVDAFDRGEFNRLFARVKAEVSTVVQDASKKRPLFSKDAATAVAKRDSVLAALESFIVMVDNAKKEA